MKDLRDALVILKDILFILVSLVELIKILR